eukprot:148685_1
MSISVNGIGDFASPATVFTHAIILTANAFAFASASTRLDLTPPSRKDCTASFISLLIVNFLSFASSSFVAPLCMATAMPLISSTALFGSSAVFTAVHSFLTVGLRALFLITYCKFEGVGNDLLHEDATNKHIF